MRGPNREEEFDEDMLLRGDLESDEEELKQHITSLEKTTDDSQTREQELYTRLDELQEKYAEAMGKLDQIDWESQQRENDYGSELESLRKDKLYLEQQLSDSKKSIEDVDLMLKDAKAELMDAKSNASKATESGKEKEGGLSLFN